MIERNRLNIYGNYIYIYMNLSNFHNKLPEVLCDHIKSYLLLNIIYLTNKKDYIIYKTEINTSLDSKYNNRLTKSYIIKIIKKDYNFIFNILLNIKFNSWYKAWKIGYQGNSLPCFIELLNCICIENNSEKCRELIKSKMKEKGMRKKKHKRIRILNNTWSN